MKNQAGCKRKAAAKVCVQFQWIPYWSKLPPQTRPRPAESSCPPAGRQRVGMSSDWLPSADKLSEWPGRPRWRAKGQRSALGGSVGEILLCRFADRVQTSTLAPLGLSSTLLAPRGAPGCWGWKFSQNSRCRSACSSRRDDTCVVRVRGQWLGQRGMALANEDAPDAGPGQRGRGSPAAGILVDDRGQSFLPGSASHTAGTSDCA